MRGPLKHMRHFHWRPSWNPIWRPSDVINNTTIWLGILKNIGIDTWITLLCWLHQKLWAKIWSQADAWRPSLNSRWRPPGGVFHVSPVLKKFQRQKLYHFAKFRSFIPICRILTNTAYTADVFMRNHAFSKMTLTFHGDLDLWPFLWFVQLIAYQRIYMNCCSNWFYNLSESWIMQIWQKSRFLWSVAMETGFSRFSGGPIFADFQYVVLRKKLNEKPSKNKMLQLLKGFSYIYWPNSPHQGRNQDFRMVSIK